MLNQKLNTVEAASHLGIRPNTLEVWRCKHKGPRYSKIGSRVLYDINDLEEFFKGRSIETGDSEEVVKILKKSKGAQYAN